MSNVFVLDEPRQLRAGGGLGVRDERGRVPLHERAGVACDERTTRSGGQLVFSAQDACLRLRYWH
jgi:hypothetical protein